MTANRELNSARPTSTHRPSSGSLSSSSATMASSSRPSQSRPHAHSLSAGSLHPQHRVSRRKSMSNTTTAANAAAMAALVKGESVNSAGKRGSVSKSAATPRAALSATGGAFPSSLPSHSPLFNGLPNTAVIREDSVLVDGPPLNAIPAAQKGNKSKMRRASEGSRLSSGKSEGRRVASGAELRCETCGKGYKHSSCLTKHLWEHTPEWAITSKLLISKHQQVQLLEAASVLVNMNQDPVAGSEHSSPSPAASGSSDPRDDESISTSYTPPPQPEEPAFAIRTGFGHTRLESTGSSAYSQSYNSVFSDLHGSNGRPYVSHYRQWSSDNRPSTSGTSYEDEEQADLAAAVGLLSCSYGTPKTGPVVVLPDVPPVPPLPARFLGQKTDALSGSTIQPTPQLRGNWGYRHADSQDVDMSGDSEIEAEHHATARGRSEEDEGVFGKMEE